MGILISIAPHDLVSAASGKSLVSCVEWYGFASVLLMMITYTLESRASSYTLAFAVGCGMAAYYAFLVSAWPFALVETVWAGLAARKWYLRVRPRKRRDDEVQKAFR